MAVYYGSDGGHFSCLLAARPLSRSMGFVLAFVGGAALVAPSAAVPQKEAAATAPCMLQPFASGTVKAITDGRTFVLDDGRLGDHKSIVHRLNFAHTPRGA